METRIILALYLSLTLGAVSAVGDTKAPNKTREGIERRITADIRDLRETVEASGISRRHRKRLIAEIDGLEQEFEAESVTFGADFRAVLPLNPLHARLFEAQAGLWRAQGHAPLTVWVADLWGNLTLWAPPKTEPAPEVRVHMMTNEYRAGAFNMSNASPDAVSVRLRIGGIPGGVNPGYVSVHQVEWTDTRTGRVVAAALPEAGRDGGDYTIDVPSGLTRQVWLTFHPTKVPAGVHTGTIELTSNGERFEVPLVLHVYAARFPDRPSLHSGGWDYTSVPGAYGVTEENIEAFLKHCREHYVDSPWARNVVIPRGGYDEKGNMISEPNTARFDTWVERWSDARRYCIFPNFGSSFGGFAVGTPECETAVKDYVTFWANHVEKQGIKPEQLVWLLIDEPRAMETDTLIVAWAKMVRAADTGIQIWEDPIYADMSEAHPELGSVCHILCPNRTMFLNAPQKYGQYYLEQRDKGATLEFYSCRGPARLLDPYAYYRMQAWSCWQHDAISTNFWAWGDNAGVSSWNEYVAPRTAFTPFFVDPTSITAGKQMEACREGIQDYEYFVMLRGAIESAEKAGRDDDTVKQARALLEELPGRVLNAETLAGFWWRDAFDRTLADKARVEMLEALVALKKDETT